jgi:Protein of unknown function (DUF2490)
LRHDHQQTRAFWRVREEYRAGIAVAISRRVMERTSQRGSQKFVEMVMRAFTRFARYLVPSALVVFLMSLAAPCAAQENVDAPTLPAVPDLGGGRGSLFAPSAWLVLSTPVRKQIDLKLYGFYIGDLDVPVTQVDVSVRATKFLTITPSYLYNWIPPKGLNEIASQPRAFTDSYQEHQARIDGTFTFPIRKFEISARNMLVRRFREGPAKDINRYRGRISIAHPVAVEGHIWKPFASYETFYERGNGGWNRVRIWTGVTLPLNRHVFFQPSYMWERSDGSRDLQYLLLGLTVSTK